MKLRYALILLIAPFTIGTAILADEVPNIKGVWDGQLSFSPQSPKMPVQVTFSFVDEWEGQLVFVGKNENRPQILTDLIFRDGAVSFALPSSPKMEFKGKFDGKTIDGSLKLVGLPSGSNFTLTRSKPAF